MFIGTYDPADPNETDAFSVDLTNRLGTDTLLSNSATVTLSVITGTDAAPNTHLSGGPVIVGNIVTQLIGGLVAGVSYEIVFTASTSSGRILSSYGIIPCKAQTA